MSAEYEEIHEAVRADPEAIWDRLRVFLCSSEVDPHLERLDLIEDLMFWHPDAFIDRLERLVTDCPDLAQDVVDAHVGGVGPTPGLERFYALQDRLASGQEGRES